MKSEPRTNSRTHARTGAAFTLIELIAVLVLVGILSAAATPAFSRLGAARHSGLAREIDRLLSLARGMAGATGMPTGVRFDLGDQTAEVVRITAQGEEPTPVESVASGSTSDTSTTTSEVLLVVEVTFPGSRIESASFGPGFTDTLWFDHAGTPHRRTDSGTLVGALSVAAEIGISGGLIVTVQPYTGLVER